MSLFAFDFGSSAEPPEPGNPEKHELFKILGLGALGCNRHHTVLQVGGSQNYGPFLGTLNNRCRIMIGTQTGAIILTTTQVAHAVWGLPSKLSWL